MRDPSDNPVFDIAIAYQQTAALIAAVKLNIFTMIGAGTTTVAALSEGTGASTRGIRILCDFLTAIGLLAKQQGGYCLTPVSARYLDTRSASAIGSSIDFAAAPEMLRLVLDDPVEYVRNGGSKGLAHIAPDHPIWVRFARGMAPAAAVTAKRVAAFVSNLPDRPLRVLDVATGHGLYGIEIARALPAATVDAIDWAEVLAVARENAIAAGVQDRIQTFAGSAFDAEWGSGFDLVLLANFLHHFDRERNVVLLRKARASLSPNGRVLVIDFVPNPDRTTPTFAANFAFWMLASTPGGDVYTLSELEEMGRSAGFTHFAARPLLPTPETLAILRP